MPSLSVVQTDPSRRRERGAGAFLTGRSRNDPPIRPSTNHLKPTGVSTSLRPSFVATRSMIALLTMGLAHRGCFLFQAGRFSNRYAIAAARGNGSDSSARWSGVTIPCRVGVGYHWRKSDIETCRACRFNLAIA